MRSRSSPAGGKSLGQVTMAPSPAQTRRLHRHWHGTRVGTASRGRGGSMHVVIQHRITDPERFFAGDPEEVATGGPPGVKGRQFVVSQDRSAAVCLWEADSVESLRDYMEGLTGDSADNT